MTSKKNFAQKLLQLAEDTVEDKEKMVELFQEIETCFTKNTYVIDEVLDELSDNIDSNNLIAFNLLQQVCEQLSSSNEVYGETGTPYRAAIFAIPIVFVQPKGTSTASLQSEYAGLEKIIKALKSSGVFPQECNLYMHNNLYSPEQITDISYNQIHDMYVQMCNIFCEKPFNFSAVEFPTFEELPCEDDTLQLRYLIGMKMHGYDMPIQSESEKTKAMQKFNDEAAPIISEMLDVMNVNIISVDDFHQGAKAGLEFYTSLTRRLDIEKVMEDLDQPAGAFEAVLNFDSEDITNSKIEMRPKVKDFMGEANMYALPFQNFEDLSYMIAFELEDIGLSLDDIYVKVDQELVPINVLIDHDPQAEKEAIEFLNDTTI